MTGAEDDEDAGADGEDGGGQVEDGAPLGVCRSVVRQRADHVRRSDRRQLGHQVGQSDDVAGVQRRQVELVGRDERERHALERDGDEHERHGKDAVAADESRRDDGAGARKDSDGVEQLADDVGRHSAGRSQPVGQPADRNGQSLGRERNGGHEAVLGRVESEHVVHEERNARHDRVEDLRAGGQRDAERPHRDGRE